MSFRYTASPRVRGLRVDWHCEDCGAAGWAEGWAEGTSPGAAPAAFSSASAAADRDAAAHECHPVLSEKYLEAMAYIRDQTLIAGLAAQAEEKAAVPALQELTASSGLDPDPAAPDPPPDPAAQIRMAIAEPLGLPGGELPGYDATPAGGCRSCHLPAGPARHLCFYCAEAEERRHAKDLAGAGYAQGRTSSPWHCNCQPCGAVRTAWRVLPYLLLVLGVAGVLWAWAMAVT